MVEGIDWILKGGAFGGIAALLYVVFQFVRGRNSDAVSAWELFVRELKEENKALKLENAKQRKRIAELERALGSLQVEFAQFKATFASVNGKTIR